MNETLKIAVDFDGTCVDHRFPDVGQDAPGAVRTLKDLHSKGHRLILWTMRCGSYLEEAVQWFTNNNIPLWGIQCDPAQETWTTSKKCYAQLYIDDAAFGCPLIQPARFKRPCVDWDKVRKHFRLDWPDAREPFLEDEGRLRPCPLTKEKE